MGLTLHISKLLMYQVYLFIWLCQILVAECEIHVGSSASGEVPREELEVERALGTLDATHKVPRNPGLPREEH